MYHLATVHFFTERQTDRRQYHGNSRSYCVLKLGQYLIALSSFMLLVWWQEQQLAFENFWFKTTLDGS